ncbi:hypothetical protein [Neptunicoccus sediminis]|uniref:hypothetical protein n=1 Tax=Neptunicoccus sediminis TaxID=1892596 RepID=UPI000846158F|nr:hypothetical protein [Neptunicoccus sediminis]
MFKRLTSTALVFGMAALAPPVAAAPCGPRAEIVTHLAQTYQEVRRGAGLSSATRVVELWSSAQTGSFSILLSYPNGMACVLATGSNWSDATPFDAAVIPDNETAT